MIPVPRTGIKAVLAAITGLPAGQVIWSPEPEPAVWPSSDGRGPFGLLIVSGTGVNQQGWDDISRVEGFGGAMTTTSRGARLLPMTLRYDSFAPATQWLAEDALELVRTRIFADLYQAQLDALKAAVVDVGQIQRLPTPPSVNNRLISSALLQLTIRYSQVDDRTQPTDGVIKRMQATGTLSGAIGSGVVTVDSANGGGAPNGSLAASLQRWTTTGAGSSP